MHKFWDRFLGVPVSRNEAKASFGFRREAGDRHGRALLVKLEDIGRFQNTDKLPAI